MKYKAMLIALAVMLMLSACAGSSDDKKSETAEPTQSSQTSVENKSSATTAQEQKQETASNPTDDFLRTITAETAEYKGVCGADLTWYYKDGVLVIKGTGEMNDYGLDHNVVQSPWGKDGEGELYKKVHWVIMDEGVTSVGELAFSQMENLSTISLPTTMQKIGKGAFSPCNNLKSITIPASVEVVGDSALDSRNIESITFLGECNDAVKSILRYFPARITIYYSNDTFAETVDKYSGINWVKQ